VPGPTVAMLVCTGPEPITAACAAGPEPKKTKPAADAQKMTADLPIPRFILFLQKMGQTTYFQQYTYRSAAGALILRN
jgi:hypothetical protein